MFVLRHHYIAEWAILLTGILGLFQSTAGTGTHFFDGVDFIPRLKEIDLNLVGVKQTIAILGESGSIETLLLLHLLGDHPRLQNPKGDVEVGIPGEQGLHGLGGVFGSGLHGRNILLMV